MPRRALKMIWNWLDEHQDELDKNWTRARKRQATRYFTFRLVEEGIMFLHVIDAQYHNNYQLKLKFNNGAEGVIDLKSELYG